MHRRASFGSDNHAATKYTCALLQMLLLRSAHEGVRPLNSLSLLPSSPTPVQLALLPVQVLIHCPLVHIQC